MSPRSIGSIMVENQALKADIAALKADLAAREEDPRWQKLRDLFGLDGWHDGHFHGIASPDQIVTHIEYVANERARLLVAATAAEAEVEKLTKALALAILATT